MQTTERLYLSPRARATILWIAVAVTLVFLWEVREILTPFIWAFITAYVLNPVVAFLSRRTGLPRRLWVVLFYFLLLGLLVYGLGTLVPLLSAQVTDFSKELPGHIREAGKILRERGLIEGNVIDVLGTRIDLSARDAEMSRQISQALSQQFGRSALPVLAHGFEGVLKLLVYLVSTFFLLLEIERIGIGIAALAPTAVRAELGPWVRRINHVLGAYIRGQLILVVMMTVVTYIALSILGVRYAPLLAIFTGLVETMPFIGPYAAGATAVLVAITQGSAPFGWTPFILAGAVAITYTILRQLEDNLVMPFLIGRLVHLHPLIVIFSVLAGAALGGILGLLLAVPAAATVKIVATYLNSKLREEPPRTLIMLGEHDGWDVLAQRVREAALISKAAGEPRPRFQVSVPRPAPGLLHSHQFHRMQALFDEAGADAVLLTTDPALLKLAEDAGIRTESKPDYAPRAPEPDYEESEGSNLLSRIRRSGEDGDTSARRGLFVTRPLSPPKELDKDRPAQ